MKSITSLVLPLSVLTSGLVAQALPQDRPVIQNPRGPAAAPTGLTLPGDPDRVLLDLAADGGAVWALGTSWKGCFDGAAFTYVPFFGSQAERNFPVEFAVRSVTVGGATLALTNGRPEVADGRVRIARGAMAETYDLALTQVEQSFVFDSLPNRGEIAVVIGVASELAGAAREGGVRLANELGAVDYRKAVAVDAAGRRLTLPIEWRGDAIALAIPASFVAEAQLPLVLDPLISTSPALGANAANQRNADVATLLGPERIAVTWQRTWSATDEDCFAAIYDNAWNPLGSVQTIDFTSNNWVSPRIASNQASASFLVVAQVNYGTNFWVAGRTLAAAGTVGGQFDIERAGVVGNAGDTLEPDVGGDPYPAGTSYFCVVFTKQVTATDKDVCFKMVLPNSTLLSPTPTRLSTWSGTFGTPEQAPSISNSNGGNTWLVAWNYVWQSAPFDTDVRAATIGWPGNVVTTDFAVVGSLDNESRPSASSPADVGAGATRYLVAWDQFTTVGQPADIQCRTLAGDGALDPVFNLSAISAGAFQARDQIQARVDSDGARFIVAYDEFDPGPFEYFTFVDTVAFPSPNGVLGALRIDDNRTAMNCYGARPSAFRGANFAATSRYALAGHTPFAPNIVRAMLYGGYQLGTQFSVYTSQCGALPISYSGNPTVGNTVTISVPNNGFSGTVFGFPSYIPLNGVLGNCNCILGVGNGILAANPLVFTIPNNAAFVGITLSAQGYSAGGSSCLSALDLSDTVDFTIR